MAYRFTLKLEYDLEADNEDDALVELADRLKRDWIYYLDEGELTKIED